MFGNVCGVVNRREIIKTLSNPQNLYDGLIAGLHFMPTKSVAVAGAAIPSGAALIDCCAYLFGIFMGSNRGSASDCNAIMEKEVGES